MCDSSALEAHKTEEEISYCLLVGHLRLTTLTSCSSKITTLYPEECMRHVASIHLSINADAVN